MADDMIKAPGALCTLLVCSCDAYADLWRPCFSILRRQWPDCPFPLVLNTESGEYPGVRAVHPQNPDAAWTRRLQQALAQLDTTYVLLYLDDFFLTGPADTARVLQCLAWMQADPECACFSFFPTSGNLPADHPGFELRPQNGLYRFNAQAGLWPREKLMQYLDADENAWEWENEGNLRSHALSEKFYSEKDSNDRILPYDYMKHGLIGGKWFPETKELFARYGIEADFTKRGFYDPARWMLLPSVKSAFQLDSLLYWDDGTGLAENRTLTAPVQKDGAFVQKYALPASARAMLRWDPATRRGFALRGLRVRFVCGGKQIETQPKGGNGRRIEVGGEALWVFLQEDPQMMFALPRNADTLEVCGEAVCPLTEEMVVEAENQAAAPKKSFFERLLHRGG